MSQATELAKVIEQLAVAQGGTIFLLCEDGSQVSLKIVEGNADTQYCDTVVVETYRPIE
jgi:hypothetical protein